MANRYMHLRSTTAGNVPPAGTAADFGRIAFNLADRKLWGYNASGSPILLAARVTDHVATSAYRIADLVVRDDILYRCIADIGPKAWSAGDWVSISDFRSSLIYRAPTAQAQSTITMGGAGIAFDVKAHAAQSVDLQRWYDGAGNVTAAIKSDGYPSAVFGQTVVRVNQTAHSFSAVGQVAAFDGANWILARADTPATFGLGVVKRVVNANAVELQFGGRVDGMQAGAFQSGAYAANTLYYLSTTNAGQLTSAAPPDPADRNVILRTTAANSAVLMFQLPGESSGGGGGTTTNTVITQPGHPFAQVGRVATFTGSGFALANGAASASAPVGVVAAIAGDDFTLVTNGVITGIASGAVAAGEYPLTVGTAYYSNTTGQLTATPPANGSARVGGAPVLWAIAGDAGIVQPSFQNPNVLQPTLNLSDLTSVPAAITNLGLDDVVRTSRTISAGTGLTGGGSLAANRTLSLSAGSIASLALADTAVQPAITISAGTGLTGGGSLAANRTLSLSAGSIASLALADTAVQPARTISTGDGLTGGGNLSVNRTFAVDGTVVRTTRTLTAGDGLSGGGDLSLNRTFAVDSSVVRTSRNINSGTGLTGGGSLGADRTLSLTGRALAMHNLTTLGLLTQTAAGVYAGRSLVGGDGVNVSNGDGAAGNPSIAVDGSVVRTTRTLTAGDGLSGGGDLSANRTFAVDSTVVRTSRAVSTGTGLTGGGDLSSNRTIALTGQALALHGAAVDGFFVLAPGGAIFNRTFVGGDGVDVTNGTGAAGNPSIAVDGSVVRTSRTISSGAGITGGGDLSSNRTLALTGQALALHNHTSNGIMVRTGASSYAGRSVVGGTGLTVTNGNGVSGDPTINFDFATEFMATQGVNTVRPMNPFLTFKAIEAYLAASTFGAVGTYALMSTFANIAANTTLADAGDTVAGSDLRPLSMYGSSNLNRSVSAVEPTGTWRCMGFLRNSGGSAFPAATLFLRIS